MDGWVAQQGEKGGKPVCHKARFCQVLTVYLLPLLEPETLPATALAGWPTVVNAEDYTRLMV